MDRLFLASRADARGGTGRLQARPYGDDQHRRCCDRLQNVAKWDAATLAWSWRPVRLLDNPIVTASNLPFVSRLHTFVKRRSHSDA